MLYPGGFIKSLHITKLWKILWTCHCLKCFLLILQTNQQNSDWVWMRHFPIQWRKLLGMRNRIKDNSLFWTIFYSHFYLVQHLEMFNAWSFKHQSANSNMGIDVLIRQTVLRHHINRRRSMFAIPFQHISQNYSPAGGGVVQLLHLPSAYSHTKSWI